MAVQALGRKATLVVKACDKIMQLPGASLARIGEFKTSVTDLRTAMDDLRRSKIVPLSRELAGAPGVERLLREQLQAAIINRNAGREGLKNLQSALSAYDLKTGPLPGGSPVTSGGQNGTQNNGVTATQLSDSFLDKLVDLSARASNQEYRQKLTDGLIEEGRRLAELEGDTEFLEALLAGPRGTSVSVEGRDARVRQIEQELSATIKGLEEVYEDLSVKNLNPGTALYSVSGPVYTSVERNFGLRRAALYVVLSELIIMLVAVLACGVHAMLNGKVDRAPAAAA